jgi:hypothetical protein
MTTPWKIEPIWAGETVAVLAAGPSMNQELADSVRQHKCIALNHTVKLAPWADMFLALDPGPTFCAELPDFSGMRICGIADPNTDALYAGMFYERVTIGSSNVIEIRNNGLAAIRIAAATGAKKILLCGFDPSIRGYWTGELSQLEKEYLDSVVGEPYPGLTAGLEAIIAELRAHGIEIDRHALPVTQTVPVAKAKRSNV